MPTTATPGPRGFTRRTGLLAVALVGPAALLAACTQDDSPAPTDTQPSGGGVDAAGGEAAGEALDEAALVARYDAVLADPTGIPAAALAVLESIRDQHIAHRDALGGASPASAPATTTGPWPAPLSGLIDAERAASRSRIGACVDAADAELARLLALVGASEASHVPALKELGA